MDILALRLAALPDMEVLGSASDSEEGLLQIEELRPSVLLLDTKMKQADGIEVCRQASFNSCVRVIVLTSFSDPQERAMAY